MNAKELELKLSDALQREDVLKQQLAESQREFRAADATIENLQMHLNAEREAKLALAAENAGLKHAAEFAIAPDMWEELGGNVMRYQYQEWYADRLKSAMETPATDAFLAEVRAQGVEMLRDSIAEVGGSIEDTIDFYHYCSDFAAEVRKGVQS
ncbi:hypothetical protein KX927_02915 [Escherichia coli]|uniref:hypothetical protein n=1 Tax=Escherichia coli TaxID=562 RepID=UPI0019311AE8|nr:hypothetical protein [Escherichia coli]MBL7389775.1 hypothetical protein [Escherichia coli]UWH33016.1 hypothetical protein KYX58_02280 [Escherichia coli]UWH37680.1 hypothetical protein KX927_02915 [Escherichia coli]